MNKKKIKHFTFNNTIGEIPELSRKTEALGQEWELPPSLTMNVNLVLEEALTNIINYAFNDNGEHKIRVSISQGIRKLTIRIKDDGIPFDPSARPQPDITLPAMDRPIGGLGILLISKIMDTVHYSRENDQNILTLTKKL